MRDGNSRRYSHTLMYSCRDEWVSKISRWSKDITSEEAVTESSPLESEGMQHETNLDTKNWPIK